MRPRTQTLLAWSLFVLILAGVVVNQIGQNAFDSLSVPYLAMALVGAVIVSRTGGAGWDGSWWASGWSPCRAR